MRVQRIQVERVSHEHQPMQPRGVHGAAWTHHALPLSLAVWMPWLLLLLASPISFVVATPTGSADPFNSTLSAATPSDPVASLPIGSGAAVGILCAAVVLVCCCLFLCARSQIGARKSKHSGSGATGVGAVGTAAAARSARMRAKLEAMRRGWRKSDTEDALTGVVLSGGARESAHASAHSSLAQSHAIHALAGGSMGGLGACRWSAFAQDDFVDEPWATVEVLESLRVSGNILDVVLTAHMSMALSALSGMVPLAITVALPFHRLILAKLDITDWYGRIESVEFSLCITISGTALAVHVLSYLVARSIFHYDRSPSIQKQTQELKTAARIEEQRRIQAAAITAAATGAVTPQASNSPGTVTRVGSAGPGPSPSSPGPGSGPSMSPVTQAARNGLFLRQPTFAFTSPAAAFAANTKATPTGLGSPSGVAAAPIVATGSDPNLLPLISLCVCSLGCYLLLGFAGFIAMDESIGRQYGLTSTPRKLWPPSAGHGPFITFLVCVIVGATAMVPIAFSLKLLALFKPRHVHPNLMPMH